jgi:nicotinamide riboside transporter PnuC
MNRAFLIVGIPGFCVALAYIALGWGARASMVTGIVVLTITIAAAFLWRRKQREAGR